MHTICCLTIALLTLLAVSEYLYIRSLRRNIRAIAEAFREKIAQDTNTIVTVNTADTYIRKMATAINHELQALRTERLKLQQGDAELKNAVANIAHDLRTPLTAISGYLELLEDTPTTPQAAEYLDIIRERTEALKNLTEELFRYSVITTTSDDLKPVPLSLKSQLEIALAGAYGMLVEKHIKPEIEITEENVTRTLDPAALQRIFANILSNAAKYSDGDLRVSLTADGTITFANSTSSLTEVEAARLFDRFYTVENSKGSTGLGLSIARHLTEKMGGSIRADVEKGRGYCQQGCPSATVSIRITFPESPNE